MTTSTKTSLWQGLLRGETDPLFAAINDSLSIDARLVQEDIEGSIAWARALERGNVLDSDEAESIEAALREIAEEARENPQAIIESGLEDIHTWVEHQLTERLGALGKKLHTGRSRNDQVATDLRLWTMRAIDERRAEICALQDALVELGLREQDAVMPGYTHLQRAQPVLFAHWCLAYREMLHRDGERFADARSRTAHCPLGCGALSGTAFPIDRTALAQRLGFDQPARNSLDAVSDRDFVVESLSAIALCAVHLSRMAEDLIFYASSEAGFVSFDDSLTSGSSMMPQKKNPDALELVRGKAGSAIGALASMCITLKGLPLSYNKDLQEDKATLFGAMDNLSISLQIATRIIGSLRVHGEVTRAAAEGSHANATELADYLVTRGVPFRDAHSMTGRLVQRAIEMGVTLQQLPKDEITAIAPQADTDVRVHLTIERSLEKRDALGGTSPRRVEQALKQARSHTGTQGRSVTIVPAAVDHLDEIARLVDYWALQGENLPRSRDEILESLSDFGVALHDGNVVGCGSLVLYSPKLAEIRSLGVDPSKHGMGVGSKLVSYFTEHARKLHIPRVFVLTRAPAFFERNGFKTVPIDVLPEKVFKDCAKCCKQAHCDEIAMIHDLTPISR